MGPETRAGAGGQLDLRDPLHRLLSQCPDLAITTAPVYPVHFSNGVLAACKKGPQRVYLKKK